MGMKVGRQARKLHFLHATAWPSPEKTTIGFYQVRFENGHLERIPIVYGEHVLDWFGTEEFEPPLGGPTLVWRTGKRRLFKSTWLNSQPDVAIVRLDFVSAVTDSSPFLLAITADP